MFRSTVKTTYLSTSCLIACNITDVSPLDARLKKKFVGGLYPVHLLVLVHARALVPSHYQTEYLLAFGKYDITAAHWSWEP
jgi:hypothetical protein